MDSLPQDPIMLLSAVNMKLRDSYDTIDALCDDMNIDKAELENKLKEVGFEYNPDINQFR